MERSRLVSPEPESGFALEALKVRHFVELGFGGREEPDERTDPHA